MEFERKYENDEVKSVFGNQGFKKNQNIFWGEILMKCAQFWNIVDDNPFFLWPWKTSVKETRVKLLRL